MTHPSSVGALPRICHPVPPDFDPRKDAGRVSNEEQVCVQFFATFLQLFATFFSTFLASNQKYGCQLFHTHPCVISADFNEHADHKNCTFS
jgi:hypothetical protein